MNNIFEELFVLELANNHWGSVERGLKIIEEFSHVVRFNNVRAAIKLQIRDVKNFIHKDFRERQDIRYIKKTIDTRLDFANYETLTKAIKAAGCITMATPFDEKSVEICEKLDIEILKIASSDINDWVLIERIAKVQKPVIVSTGGSSLKDIDDLVKFFKNRNIPLAINHCISQYPTEKQNLELNQIDFLKKRYPENIIGFSTHERNEEIELPMMMAYAKGARTFERHIDIDSEQKSVSPYCSRPADIDRWFKAYKKAAEICGSCGGSRRIIPQVETEYLDALVRGVYAKDNLSKGHILCDEDIYLSIPLQRGQISCREFMRGERLTENIQKDEAIKIKNIDSPYAHDDDLTNLILKRGL